MMRMESILWYFILYVIHKYVFKKSSLTTDAAKTLAPAFVGGRLDYCNCLLYGVSEDLRRRLQSVQNAAARFITGARK